MNWVLGPKRRCVYVVSSRNLCGGDEWPLTDRAANAWHSDNSTTDFALDSRTGFFCKLFHTIPGSTSSDVSFTGLIKNDLPSFLCGDQATTLHTDDGTYG
jgi:hypothetical protein